MPVSAQPGGFEALFGKIMNYVYPVGQVVFWLALIAIFYLAWRDFRRLVDYYAPRTKGAKALQEEEIKIEEFVD